MGCPNPTGPNICPHTLAPRAGAYLARQHISRPCMDRLWYIPLRKPHMVMYGRFPHGLCRHAWAIDWLVGGAHCSAGMSTSLFVCLSVSPPTAQKAVMMTCPRYETPSSAIKCSSNSRLHHHHHNHHNHQNRSPLTTHHSPLTTHHSPLTTHQHHHSPLTTTTTTTTTTNNRYEASCKSSSMCRFLSCFVGKD